MHAMTLTLMPRCLAAWLLASRALGTWFAIFLCAVIVSACGGGGSESTGPVAPTAATITSLSPASVGVGSGPFTLTVDGSGFVAASVVSLNGAPLLTTFVSATQLSASVPAAAVASAGNLSATVLNPSNLVSNTASFTTTAPPAAPSITAISPATATAGTVGFTLSLSGSGFTTTSVVSLGGSALSTSFVSATQLTAVVPSSALASAASLAVQVADAGANPSNALSLVVSTPSTGIGPQGGTVTGAYGAQVIVPAGALASTVDIAIARDSTNAPDFPPSDTGAAGAAFEITPHGTSFAQPVTVRIPFDAAQVPADAKLKLFKAEAGGQFAEIATTVDGNRLVAEVTSLSWFVPAYAATRPRNVYALSSLSGVSSYRINAATGALSAATSTAPTGQSPTSVLAHPSGRFVYVTNGGSAIANGVAPNSISVYRLDAISGAISGPTSTRPASTAPLAQQASAGLAVAHPSGRFVYVVNFGPFGSTNTDVSVFSVDGATGALSGPTSSADSAGAPPSAIAIDPSGRFAYVTYIFRVGTPVGNTYFDQVKVFSIDANTGLLNGPTSSAAAASFPWSAAVEPLGRFAYVASRDRNSNRVHAYSIDATTGALTARSASLVLNQPASIAIDPLARFAYVGLQETFGDNVESFRINPFFGALNNPVGFGLVAGGGAIGPIAVVAEPQGQFIYAMHTGNSSSELAAFRVNASTGALASAGAVTGVMSMGGFGAGTPFAFAATGTSPIWVNDCTFDCTLPPGGGGSSVGSGSDTTAPSIAITGPTSAPTYASSNVTLTTLSGTASDAVGVTQVTWSNNRGGSGTASGTTSWSVGSIALQSGVNAISVTARDAAGNSKTDSVLVSFSAGGAVASTQFLNVTRGVWGGRIVSTPAGIDYGDTTNLFSAGFPNGTVVQLCETPPPIPVQAYDVTWTGACSGTTRCTNVLMDRGRECRLELTPR